MTKLWESHKNTQTCEKEPQKVEKRNNLWKMSQTWEKGKKSHKIMQKRHKLVKKSHKKW